MYWEFFAECFLSTLCREKTCLCREQQPLGKGANSDSGGSSVYIIEDKKIIVPEISMQTMKYHCVRKNMWPGNGDVERNPHQLHFVCVETLADTMQMTHSSSFATTIYSVLYNTHECILECTQDNRRSFGAANRSNNRAHTTKPSHQAPPNRRLLSCLGARPAKQHWTHHLHLIHFHPPKIPRPSQSGTRRRRFVSGGGDGNDGEVSGCSHGGSEARHALSIPPLSEPPTSSLRLHRGGPDQGWHGIRERLQWCSARKGQPRREGWC
jgi:hypothetical protein